MLGAFLFLLLPACGAHTGLGDSVAAATCPGGIGARSCPESVAAFCAKVGCPLHAFSLDPDPEWCTIGGLDAGDAQADNSDARWFSVGIDNKGTAATLFYDWNSADLVFVLETSQGPCLAGEVPRDAQCQGFRYVGVGLACY